MSALGIENVSVFGLPPVDFVKLVAGLGCQHLSTGLTGFDFGIYDYPAFSLREDAALRREMIAAMRDSGVSISLGEGCTIRPGVGAADYARDLDVFGELGTLRINTVSMDPDLGRTFDEFAILTRMAAERGMVTTTELSPSLAIPDLPTALNAVRHVDSSDFKLLIDTMHVVRSGSVPADIAALDPTLIDYIQVSDAPRVSPFDSYFEESMFERMVPGEGELGLAEIFAVLPADRIYAIEVPLRSKAKAGESTHDRLARCVAATRRLLEQASTAKA